jgi:predicted Fe-Mo cluster-binding NifX family protein
MKIAFTTSGTDLTAPFDSRFGRTPKFLICDLQSDSYEVIDNQQNQNSAQGAGIQAAETIIRRGAKVLVTGHCGPKAFRVLQAAGIKVYHSDDSTVALALEKFKNSELRELSAANVEGHWA